MSKEKQSSKSMLLDLAFNLVIPVLILQKLSHKFGNHGPMIALIAALAFPLSFGIYDLFVKKKKNIVSVLGFINILFTGGFALLGLTRTWYIAKELLLPGMIGAYVWFTIYGDRPFIEVIFFNDNVFNLKKINEAIEKQKTKAQKKLLMLRSTQLFASTFLISAIGNFFIAIYVFTDIPHIWTASERAAIRNFEIAEMKKWHYIVLLLPSLAATVFLMWYLISGLKKITGLTLEELMTDHSASSSSSS